MLKIDTSSDMFSPRQIEKIEKAYKAKYVLESCVKTGNGNWLNKPCAIFYTEKAHPEGSNYFAMYANEYGQVMITNGISATEPTYTGIVSGDKVIYSHFRHDYRSDGSNAIDGGRDYMRIIGDPELAMFKVVGDHLELIGDKHV